MVVADATEVSSSLKTTSNILIYTLQIERSEQGRVGGLSL